MKIKSLNVNNIKKIYSIKRVFKFSKNIKSNFVVKIEKYN